MSKKMFPTEKDSFNRHGIGPFNDGRPDLMDLIEDQATTVFEPKSNETEVTERGFVPPLDPNEGGRGAKRPWSPKGRKR